MNEYDYITNAFTKEGENTNLEVDNLNVGCITSKNSKFELDSNGNLTVQSINAQSITSSALLNAMYPIGSIYMSINENNPSTIFGGQWEQIKDKFLLSCGDTYQNGAIGGEAIHKLTINEMPVHKHNVATVYPFSFGAMRTAVANSSANDKTGLATDVVENAGGNQPHNNMPPYLAVYMWKRIS